MRRLYPILHEHPARDGDAAMIDGANPFRTPVSVILPQPWPAH
jgi:ABC-type glycerol-3-phosphate transport system permease component